jgi:6-phosphogluconolactonase
MLEAVVERAATLMEEAVAARGRVMLALSGGNTPRLYLPMLGDRFQRWDFADIRLVDDRWVSTDHVDSNEGMVRQFLPQARLSGLVNGADRPLAGLDEASASMAACPEPWDLALLGMGGDGHIASLFPGTGAVDDPALYCVAVPEAPLHPRISLSAAALLRFQHLLLILTGEDKLDALARAERDALPVHLLTQASERLEIFWSP